MMTVKSIIRHAVSQQRRRYIDNNYDLDLSYIGSRIIAMGYPSTGKEAIYRNPASQVKKFLDDKHANHYMIINLCSERTYTAELFPDTELLSIPFPDHQVPRIDQIDAFCRASFGWLNRDPDNVIVVHCKAGKGRTGLVVSCFLLYIYWQSTKINQRLIRTFLGISDEEDEPDLSSAQSALAYFANQRTVNSKGVTIPSQIRYVNYYEKFLKTYPQPDPAPAQYIPVVRYLVRLTMKSMFKNVAEFHFKILQGIDNQMIVFESETIETAKQQRRQLTYAFNEQTPRIIAGDIQIKFFSKDKTLCYFWLNTCFMDEKTELSAAQIDKLHKDKKNLADRDFVITLTTIPGTDERLRYNYRDHN